MWGAVFLLAVAGTAFADPQFIFPEDVPRPAESGSRIVSGWEADPGQFPFQLSLRMVSPAGAVFACGGTILTAEWGLTAAHCTAARVTIVIRAGTVNMTRPATIFETTKYYNHPLYNEAIPSIVQPHDIGLLEFGRSLTFGKLIQPIRIQRSSAKNQNYEGVQAIASGWGVTWTQGTSPENLNWVFLRLVSNEECRAAYGGSNIIADSTICTRGYYSPTQSTCQGDSGGPLTIIDDDGAITQVGVTSFVSGLGCHAGIPSGFIRPGHYLDWFEELTGVNFDWEYEPATDAPEDGTTEASDEEDTDAPDSETTGSDEDVTDAPDSEATASDEDATDAPDSETTGSDEDATDAPDSETTGSDEDGTDAPDSDGTDASAESPEDVPSKESDESPEDVPSKESDESTEDVPSKESDESAGDVSSKESDESDSSSESSESNSSD